MIKKYQDYLILFGIYLVANSLLLLNVNGIYFDDWTVFNHEYTTLFKMTDELLGSAGIVYAKIHYALGNIGNGVLVYRILVFILYFLSGLFAYKILANIPTLKKQDVFYLALLFLIAPVYLGRLFLSVVQYTVFLSVFFAAFYLLSQYIKSPKIWLRVVILALFFSSFIINSLLVFYAVPMLYLFYIGYWRKPLSLFNKVRVFVVKNIDFILLPIVFFAIKSLYFIPSVANTNYNIITAGKLLLAPFGILASFYFSFILPIVESFSVLHLAAVFIILYFLFESRKQGNSNINLVQSYWFFGLGALLFALAVFPYVAVGKFPADTWGSRHQLLVPLGFSFMFYFLVNIVVKRFQLSQYIKIFILNAFVIIFVSQSVYQGYLYKKDWLYKSAIQQNFKDSDLIKNNTTFIVRKNLGEVLVNESMLRYYEYTGTLRSAFGDDKRFMTFSNDHLQLNRSGNGHDLKNNKQYNASNWNYQPPIYLNIDMEYNTNSNHTFKRIIYLMYLELFNQQKFRQFVKQLVTITQVSKDKFLADKFLIFKLNNW